MTDRIGDTIDGFRLIPGTVQLFLFSAATWNPHRIHYDLPFATGTEGHPGLLVHGPLMGAWLLQLAESWAAPWGEVAEISYRNVKSAYVDQTLVVSGTVTSAGDSPQADVSVALEDGTLLCSGTVTARRTSAP